MSGRELARFRTVRRLGPDQAKVEAFHCTPARDPQRACGAGLFSAPPINPDMRFFLIRLPDVIHQGHA